MAGERKGYSNRQLLLAGAASVSISTVATAQEAETDIQANTPVDQIVVTSRLRETSVQDVGVSVTGISGDDVVKLGLRDFEDLSRSVAGMNVLKGRQNSNDISIRGVRDISLIATSSVFSLFYDDISVSSNGSQRDYSSVDLNRIEVIRGPQPTVFGEGAVGGVVRYFSNDPDLDGPTITGVARGNIENITDGGLAYSGENSTSLILAPGKLGLRLTGFYRRDEGFIDNPNTQEDVNDFDTAGGRAVLLARPTDDFEVRLSAFITRDEGGEFSQIDPGSNPEDLIYGVATPIIENGSFFDDFDLYSGKLTYDFGPLSVESITGYYERNNTGSGFDPGNTFGLVPFFAPGFDTTTFRVTSRTEEQWTQELRFISDLEGPLNFTAGFFFKDRKISRSNSVFGDSFDQVTTPASDELVNAARVTASEQYSGFVELMYELTDRFRVVGGVRYVDSTVTTTLVEDFVVNFVPQLVDPMNPALGFIPFTADNPLDFSDNVEVLRSAVGSNTFVFELNRFLPKGGLEFDVNDNTLLYANVALGARDGGVGEPLAALAVSGGDLDAFVEASTFDEDSVISIDGGVKTTLLDGKLLFNLGAFWTRFKDTQLSIDVPVTNLINGPDQRILGLEIETAYQVNDDLNAYFNASVLDAEFTDDFLTVAPEFLPDGFDADIAAGNEPRGIPALSFSAGYNYSRPVGSNGMRLTSNGSFQFVGERFGTIQNFPSSKLESLELLNLKVGLENDRFAVNFFSTNLLNDIEDVLSPANTLTLTVDPGGNLDAPPIVNTVNRPRTFGVSLSIFY